MADSDRRRWNEKYEGRNVAATAQPDPWLADSVAGLAPGRALELACGTGHNATWLAASPTPFASYINSNISRTVRLSASLTLVIGRDE